MGGRIRAKLGTPSRYALRGPACDSRSARDAASRWERCISSARSSPAFLASCCHPRNGSPNSRSTPNTRAALQSASLGPHNPVRGNMQLHGGLPRGEPQPLARHPATLAKAFQPLEGHGWWAGNQPVKPNKHLGQKLQLERPLRRLRQDAVLGRGDARLLRGLWQAHPSPRAAVAAGAGHDDV